jgi:hypothetical protein
MFKMFLLFHLLQIASQLTCQKHPNSKNQHLTIALKIIAYLT